VAYFDVDLGALNDDDQADVLGVPDAQQDWEVDDPRPTIGDIRGHVPAHVLDRMNAVAEPANVALAMGWTFALGADRLATATFRVSPFDQGGFALNQFDAEEDLEVYLDSHLQITPRQVPEPAIGWLGLAALLSAARRLRPRRR